MSDADAGAGEAGALAGLFEDAEAGRWPAPDGTVRVLRPDGDRAGVLAFTAHTVVVADVDPAWVAAVLPPDDLAAPVEPPFLTALAARTGRPAGLTDAVLVATPLPPGEPGPALRPVAERDHPRVVRALRYRDDVTVWAGPDGAVVALGRGLGGRTEVSVEVPPEARGRGLGRALARAARTVTGGYGGRPLWAQVSPGNAASLRAFLAAGYRPAGSEVLFPAPA